MATIAEEVYRSPLGSSQELHVLAVDDSYVDRKLIERLLQISSCKVTTVDSGTRALQYLGLDGENSTAGFDALKVNLIITDYTMPGMTGYELLKKIKKSSAFREVPVVIMSSEDVLTQIDSCLEEGAEEYIVKPVKLSDVKRLKDHIMRGEGHENGRRRIDKKKLRDDNQPLFSSPPPSSSSSTTQSLSPSVSCDLPSSELPSSSSDSSESPSSSSDSSESPFSSPSSDCPMKRAKLH